MKANELQGAVYTRISTDTALVALLSTAYSVPAIFSDVQQPADAGAGNLFPYITYAVTSLAPFDTDDRAGGNAIVQVDVWARSKETATINAIADAVDLRLRRQPLAVTGHITTELVSVTVTDDPDGSTKRALMLFRVLYL